MNPDKNQQQPEPPLPPDEDLEEHTVDHPWQSSQNEPVVHVQPAEPESPPPVFVAPTPTTPPPQKRTFRQKIGRLLKSKKFWFGLFGLLVAGFLAAWFVQPSRLWIVNQLGLRNTLTITTISPGEGQKAKVSELRNVAITINGQSYKTDDQGKLQAPNIPYGPVDITAKKAGYKDVAYGVNLDFDPFFHKFGGKAEDQSARSIELSMQAVGIPVSFKVVDWLSGKPVTVGDFAIGDTVAKPNDQGLVSLKIPGTDAAKVTVKASFGGAYIDKQFQLTLGSNDTPQITVVPGGRHYFVSKRDGQLSVYSSNIDGTDAQVVVAGTGQETSDMAFAVSPDGKYGILSSSRDGARNAKLDMVQRVYVVNLSTKQLTRVDEATAVKFGDWSGDTLAYTTQAYDATTNTYPVTLKSVDAAAARIYNFETASKITIGTVAFDKIIYLKTSSDPADAGSSPMLREATINATTSKTLGEQVGFDGYYQQDFDRIAFRTNADQAWHEYNLNTDQLKTIAQPSSGDSTVQYLAAANSNGSKRVFIQRIDGRYTLVLKDMATGTTVQLYSGAGLGGPVRWVGDVVVFRVVTNQETADYAVSINGGLAKKITDVTATASTQGSLVDQRFAFY